jgi:hypothetical protein
MSSNMTLKQAAHKLWEEIRDDPNLTSVGTDTINTIHIHTKKRVKGYPSEYEGYPVKVTKVGVIRPATA